MRMIILTEIILVYNFTYTQFNAHRFFFVNGEKFWTTCKFSAHRLFEIRGDIGVDHPTT